MSNKREFIVIDNHEDRKNYNGLLVRLCAATYPLMTIATTLGLAAFIYLLLFTKLWFLPIIYYSYLLVDSGTCNRGGRRWDWVHKARFWSYFAAHFPVRLSFATDGLGLSKLFPGIKSRIMSHESWFWLPFVREIFMLRGDCSVSSASFDYILSQKWKQQQRIAAGDSGGGGGEESTYPRPAAGNLLAVCVGGQAEADLSEMQTMKIVCATRKGFVKKALIHGAHLVPCLAFGENTVFTKVNFTPGSLAHSLETKWYQVLKFKHPIHYGDSLLPGSWFGRAGLVPYKRPITVCMGDPIEVTRTAEPSREQIDRLHALYMARLRALYEENQDLCHEYDRKLEFL